MWNTVSILFEAHVRLIFTFAKILPMKIFLILFFSLSCLLTSAQSIITEFPDTTDLNQWARFSGVKPSVHNGDSISATWLNGMLNGPYVSYYTNGKMKSKGTYKSNFRTGKWVLFSENGKGKMVLNFNQYGYVTLHRARIIGKGGVRWGRGTVRYNTPDFSGYNYTNDSTTAFVNGTTRFRHGVKNGEEKEMYSSGVVRNETHYRDGLYNGKRTLYFSNGKPQFECEYRDGTPVGERIEYAPDGSVISSRNSGSGDNAVASFQIDKYDVFVASRKMLYTDTLFETTGLFFRPDSAAPLFEVLNDAFVKGNLSAYQDNELREIYFPFHDKPDLSGLEKEGGDYKNLRGFMIKTDEFFNTQTWLMYKVPLSIQPVASYSISDSLAFQGGPWLYFPQLRSEIPSSNYHFSFFKSFAYPYMTATTYSFKPWMMDFSDTQKLTSEQLRSTETEHDLWLVFYGLKKDWKGL